MAKASDPHLRKRQESFTNSSDTILPSTPSSIKQHLDDEVEKQELTEQQKNKEKLSQLLQRAQTALLQIQTVFPFDFFPDTLTIDPNKLTFTRNTFFYSSYTESIPIINITNVDVETSIMFAALRISFISYPTQEILIKPLWKDDALKARDIISGLMITKKEHIDIEKIPIPDIQTLIQLGQSGVEHP